MREAAQGFSTTPLAAALLARKVGPDPEQPGPRIWPRQIVVGAAMKGDYEGLGRQVARRLLSGTQTQEAIDEREVALKQLGEDRRLVHRTSDHGRVSCLAMVTTAHYS